MYKIYFCPIIFKEHLLWSRCVLRCFHLPKLFFCMLISSDFVWILHVKSPVKYSLLFSEMKCNFGQFACVPREALAAYTRVNCPVFIFKLQATQVVCAWGFSACGSHVNWPAFPGNVARASFTVYIVKISCITSQNLVRQ